MDSISRPTPFPRHSLGPAALCTVTSSSGSRLTAGILSVAQNSNCRERCLLPENSVRKRRQDVPRGLCKSVLATHWPKGVTWPSPNHLLFHLPGQQWRAVREILFHRVLFTWGTWKESSSVCRWKNLKYWEVRWPPQVHLSSKRHTQGQKTAFLGRRLHYSTFRSLNFMVEKHFSHLIVLLSIQVSPSYLKISL